MTWLRGIRNPSNDSALRRRWEKVEHVSISQSTRCSQCKKLIRKGSNQPGDVSPKFLYRQDTVVVCSLTCARRYEDQVRGF